MGRLWLKNVGRWKGQNKSEGFFIYVSVRGWRCFQKEIKDKKEMERNVVQLWKWEDV